MRGPRTRPLRWYLELSERICGLSPCPTKTMECRIELDIVLAHGVIELHLRELGRQYKGYSWRTHPDQISCGLVVDDDLYVRQDADPSEVQSGLYVPLYGHARISHVSVLKTQSRELYL